MPNRILREGILTSERVARLSWPAEVFYRRLMSVVDDFGRYYAKPELIRSAAYPLIPDKVGNSDVGKWMTECVKAALVRTYTVDGKEYLELLDFRQQVRAKESKFPDPPVECAADAQQMRSTCAADAHLDGDGDGDDSLRANSPPGFDEFWSAYPKKRSKGDAEKAWKALKPSEHLAAEIIAAVGKAKTSVDWRKNGGQFIPYPASWLRAKGWEDDLLVEAPKMLSIV